MDNERSMEIDRLVWLGTHRIEILLKGDSNPVYVTLTIIDKLRAKKASFKLSKEEKSKESEYRNQYTFLYGTQN